MRKSGIALYNTQERKLTYFGVFKYRDDFDYHYDSIMSYKKELYRHMEYEVMPYANPSLPWIFSIEGITRKGHYHTTIKIMLARAMLFNYVNDKEHGQSESFVLYKILSPQVQEWKKTILNKANASKEETHRWLLTQREKYKIPLPVYSDDDIIDATCLVLYAGVNEKVL